MSNPTENIEFLNLVVKKLTGEASDGEMEQLDNYIASDPAYANTFNEYQKIWDQSGSVKNYTKDEVETEWNKLERNLDQPPASLSTKKLVFRIAAAIIVFAVAAISLFLINELDKQEVISEAEITETKLNDGTSITLNAYTELNFPKQFGKHIRRVELIGEAYFEVAEDKSRPFIIEAGAIEIEVLGTAFNVQAYDEKNETYIVVSSGVVSVSKKQHPDEKIVLKVGNKGIYNKQTGVLKLKDNEDVNFLSWKTREFIFQDTSLSLVVEKLNNAYHKNITLEQEELGQCPITVTFSNQSLDTILKVLQSTLNLQIEYEGDSILLTGGGC